jgi:predicted ArsR family transcriptional regulator
MKTNTAQKIVEYIERNQQSSVKELVDHFGYSAVAIHKQLKKLIEKGEIIKVGSPPRVFYLKKFVFDSKDHEARKLFKTISQVTLACAPSRHSSSKSL